jgi:hypothetical protein
MRIIEKSFATNYAGDMHERLDTSDELGLDAVNQRVWGLSNHRYMATVPDEDVLKVIKRGAAAIGKSPVIMAFGEALSGDDIGDLIAFMMSSAVALQLEKAPVPALLRAFRGFCLLLGPYRRVRRRCRRPGTPLLWPVGRHGRDG